MKYVYECWFENTPVCTRCMFSRPSGTNLDGETIMGCSALGSMPKCKEEGCRNDCPLKEVK